MCSTPGVHAVPAIAIFALIAALATTAQARCRASEPVITDMRASHASRRVLITDPILVSLSAAANLADAFDSIGFFNDALSLRDLAYDGSLESALFGVARIDEVLRHVLGTAAQHGSPERVQPVIAALEAASANAHAAIAPRLAAASASGTPPTGLLAGILDPATAVFPTAFTATTEIPHRWIAIRRSPRATQGHGRARHGGAL